MRIWPLRTGRRSRAAIEADKPVRNQELLVLCHARDAHGLAALQNLCAVLAFAKIHFTVLDISRNTPWPALEGFPAIVLCTQRLNGLDSDKIRRLRDRVSSGGGLFVAYRCWTEGLRDVFGVRDNGKIPAPMRTSGLSIEREICPGARGLNLAASELTAEHSRLDLTPDDLEADCTVLATDGGGMPVFWHRTFGRGRVVFWNTSILLTRALRGFALPAVLDAMGTGVAAIGGFAMFHVDDFPTSLSDARPEPVAAEFPDLDWNGFIFDVWHRDMMALREEFGLRYSWYAILNYQDVETGPGADPLGAAVLSGADVLRRRFERIASTAPDDEYGFHGYNHEPLVADHWPDAATLRAKLDLARELWRDIVPAPMPTSWVPANNWYDQACLTALKEVFPDISTVCGVHSVGEYDKGEFREFGPDPWLDTILCLPRQTYGYRMTPDLEAMTLSQAASMGIWTHFVHPDDLFDVANGADDAAYRRNPDGRMWRATNAAGLPGLFPELRRWVAHVRSLYPWMDFVTTLQAEERYRAHIANPVEIGIGEDFVDIISGQGGLFQVMMPAGRMLRPSANGETVETRDVEGGALAIVRCGPGRTRFQLV